MGAVKTLRALSDSVIVHEPTKDWALPKDHDIYDHVKMARLTQNMETPLDKRISKSSWPEALVYLSSAAMDSKSVGPELTKTYKYSFRKYIESWTPMDFKDQPEPLSEDPELNDYELNKLNDLRNKIKKDRDRWFIENRYDDLGIETVPKSFWLSEEEINERESKLDEYSQSVLEDY